MFDFIAAIFPTSEEGGFAWGEEAEAVAEISLKIFSDRDRENKRKSLSALTLSSRGAGLVDDIARGGEEK